MPRPVSALVILGTIAAVTALVVSRLDAAEKDEVRRIADLVKSDKDNEAKAAAARYAQKHPEIDELMEVFGKSRSGGLFDPSFERQLADLARKVPAGKEVAPSEDLGNVSAAAALILERMPAPKVAKKWTEISKSLGDESRKLTTAIRRKDAAQIKDAAVRVTAACAACHDSFRIKGGIGAPPAPKPAPPPKAENDP